MNIVNIDLNELSNIFNYILDKVEDCYSEEVKASIANYLNTVKVDVPKVSKNTYTVVLQEGEQIFAPIVCLTLENAIIMRKEIFTKYCEEKNVEIANPEDFVDFEKAVWAYILLYF